MKMLLLTLEYPPFAGGVGKYLSRIVADAPSPKDVSVVSNVKSWKKAFLVCLPKVLRSRPQYFAVSHVIPMGYVALALKWCTFTPYIVFTHGTDILTARRSRWKRWWMRIVLRNAAIVVANSVFTASLLVDEGIDDAEKITPCVPQEEIDETTRIQKAPHPVILSVGRLVPRKGFDIAIRALRAVRGKHPDARLVIVGTGPDKERLEKLALAEGVSEFVTFAGAVSDDLRRAYLGSAHVYVAPGRTEGGEVEGFGIHIIEASAAGLPVVVAASGGAPETVNNGISGLVVASNDVDALVDGILHVLKSPAAADEMGAEGRKFVRREFTCEIVNRRFWNLL